MHHPLLAWSICLRRLASFSSRRRHELMATWARVASLSELRAMLASPHATTADERDVFARLIAPIDLPAPVDCEPVGLLGRGGMGEAWLCGSSSGELAVLKVLHEDLRDFDVVQERFRREIIATCALRHPNVVTALAGDADDGWLLLEFVAGGDLRAIAQGTGPFSEGDCLAIALQVVEGLSALESAGLVHRDLKPANLYMTPDGTVKIADLGLACRGVPDRTRLTAPGFQVGSVRFMSPEQFAGDPDVDHRSDFFSLGATMANLRAGPVVLNRQGPLTLAQVKRALPLSPAMHEVLAALLAERAARPADTSQMRELLRTAAAGIAASSSLPSLQLRTTAHQLATADRDETHTIAAMPTTSSTPIQGTLLFGRFRGPERLFCFSGTHIIVGKLRGGDVDLPVRRFPIEAHCEALEELSRRHVALGFSGSQAWVRDLGSANGTRLDGTTLSPHHERPLTLDAEQVLDCAGQMHFVIRASTAAILIRRLNDTPTITYALVRGPVRIGTDTADLVWYGCHSVQTLAPQTDAWTLDGRPLFAGMIEGWEQTWVRQATLDDFDHDQP